MEKIKDCIQDLIELEKIDDLIEANFINMYAIFWINYMEYYIDHLELGYSKTESKKRTLNRFKISAKTFYKAKKALVVSD